VPAGEYQVTFALDLSPLFGNFDLGGTVRLTPPPDDAIDQRIGALASGDPEVRREAVRDLPYFSRHRQRVGWALAACLTDPDGVVRRLALASLQSYPDRAAAHADTILHILEDGTGRVRGERTNAALLASRTVPPSARALAAFRKALAEGTEYEKRIFQSALAAYLERTEAEQED
jgi:hypothetical protein